VGGAYHPQEALTTGPNVHHNKSIPIKGCYPRYALCGGASFPGRGDGESTWLP